MPDPELVVLLDDDARPIGTADKSLVHSATTPLHLAFSCYLVNDDGELLVTRRALTKQAWPGVWTNAFCGHPAPSEPLETAVRRRAAHELSASLEGLELALPDFRYRAIDAGGIVENEICPVFTGRLTSGIVPEPSEVSDWAWIAPARLAEAVALAPFAFSPWLRAQLPQLLAADVFAEPAPAPTGSRA